MDWRTTHTRGRKISCSPANSGDGTAEGDGAVIDSITEFERLKLHKDEIIQRQMEAVQRPLLTEIDNLQLECKCLRALVKRAIQLPRPWMDGGITAEKWERLCDDIFAEMDRPK